MDEKCQSCLIVTGGIEETYLFDYRGHRVCSWCQAQWRRSEGLSGQRITWEEFLTGKLEPETKKQLDDLRAMRATSRIRSLGGKG